jgi:hypothetical protein
LNVVDTIHKRRAEGYPAITLVNVGKHSDKTQTYLTEK